MNCFFKILKLQPRRISLLRQQPIDDLLQRGLHRSLVDRPARLPDLPLRAREHLDGAHLDHRPAEALPEVQLAGGEPSDGAPCLPVIGQPLVDLEHAPLRHDLLEEAVVYHVGTGGVLVQVHRVVVSGAVLRACDPEATNQSRVHARVRSTQTVEVPEPIRDEDTVSDPNCVPTCTLITNNKLYYIFYK